MDRAALEVDESFASAYEARRRHREVSSDVQMIMNSCLTVMRRLAQANHSGTLLYLSHNLQVFSLIHFALSPSASSLTRR